MAEIKLPPDEMPRDPALLGVQEFLKDVADEILEQRGEGSPALYYETRVDADPVEVQTRLRATDIFPTLGQIMLADGDSLSAVPPNGRQGDLDLYVADDNLKGVSVRAWGREDEKARFVTIGDQGPRENFVVFKDETDWARSLFVKLHYDNGQQRAIQELTIETRSEYAGVLPWFGRDVVAPAYAEQAYNGHNQKVIQSSSVPEAAFFILTVSTLFDRQIS